MPALSPTESGVLAMTLVRSHGDKYLCDGTTCRYLLTLWTKPSDPSSWLDLPSLQAMLDEAEKTKDYSPLIRTIGAVWSNPDALQMSFLKNPKHIKLDGTDSGLDLEQVEKAYALLKDLVHLERRISNFIA